MRRNIALIAIKHEKKNNEGAAATKGSLGSIAFSARARSHWVIRNAGEGRFFFLRAKINFPSDAKGLAYSVTKEEGLVWESDPINMAADDFNNSPSKPSKVDEAKVWIFKQLQAGDVPSEELTRRAEADGLSWTTVKAAKRAMGTIKAFRIGIAWHWRIANDEDDEVSRVVSSPCRDSQENTPEAPGDASKGRCSKYQEDETQGDVSSSSNILETGTPSESVETSRREKDVDSKKTKCSAPCALEKSKRKSSKKLSKKERQKRLEDRIAQVNEGGL